MKSKDFAAIMLKFADVLAAANASPAEATIRALAQVFSVAPTASVANIVKRLSDASFDGDCEGRSLADPVPLLRELKKLMTEQAKAALLADLSVVEDFFSRHQSVNLAILVEAAPALLRQQDKAPTKAVPIRNDLVSKFSRRLEEALGDPDGFVSVYKEMESDREIGKLEAAAIAKAFTGGSGATKPAALKKIWARHHNLMTLRAKSESRNGRSAA